ncbi:MAG: molybdopterin-dependent oxidoreductase [Candidatus Bathyarchaeota archaeon]|nr:molybdopterin-dependent oxidoreductase [Candidatus Termiticorpusculum sp.]
MVNFRNVLIAVIAAILVGLLLMGIVGLALQNNTPQNLYPSEVREYQGENLSSMGNMRNNAIAGTQHIDNETYRLNVTGLLNTTLNMSYDEVLSSFQCYQKVVTLHCVEGWSTKILWEGFLVQDLLEQAGFDPDASTVIFYANDGYSTALPMSYIKDNNILIAYKMNDVILPSERGFPFQLVAESQYGYKWIKWVTTIEVSNDSSYLGTWESRGYRNNATISKP